MDKTDSFESCTACTLIGGYCGGSGHPSCGCFSDGRPAPSRVHVKVINLTPHRITVCGVDYPASGAVARVSMTITPAGCPIPGVLATRQRPGIVIGLPDTEKDTIYLVSIVVITAMSGSGRSDVFAPDTGPGSVIRDSTGHIIGVKALVAVA